MPAPFDDPELPLLHAPRRHTLRLGDRRIGLPRSRALRVVLGGALVVGGVFSFLPVLGLWMLPVGALVLSVDLPPVRRLRRRTEVWWGRSGARDQTRAWWQAAQRHADRLRPRRK